MKIRSITMTSFGRFRNKTISFDDGINLIWGKNESGKSTVHAFIQAMLFGMQKMRGRAAAQDAFHRYEPWDIPAWYEGQMEFESGGKTFCLYRNFAGGSKKDSLVCLTDGEELSLDDGDLEMLLGSVSEAAFRNTVSVAQTGTRTGPELLDEIRNYIANFEEGGMGNLDVVAALGRLKTRRKQLETERKEKQNLESERKRVYREQEARLQGEIRDLREQAEQAKTGYKKTKEAEQKIPGPVQAAPDQKQPAGSMPPKKDKKQVSYLWGITAISLVITLLVCLFTIAVIPKIICCLFTMGSGLFSYRKEKETYFSAGSEEKKKAPEKPEGKMSEGIFSDETFKAEEFLWEYRHLMKIIHEKQIILENLRTEFEEYCEAVSADTGTDQQIMAVKLAEQTLTDLSLHRKNKISEQFKKQTAELFRKITGDHYEQVSMDDDLKKTYLVQNGRKIPLEMASIGTMNQFYLALRLAAKDLLTKEEELPLLMDEVFAYYDEERFCAAAAWLSAENSQTILFTCREWEAQMLLKSGIPYREICLSEK